MSFTSPARYHPRLRKCRTVPDQTLTQKILAKHFRREDHPYNVYERLLDGLIAPEHTVLDVGCGRTAPVLLKYKGRVARLIGLDLIEIRPETLDPAIEFVTGDAGDMGEVAGASVDLVISRAVMEHVEDPAAVFRELRRVLKPGGAFVTLIPNLGDYVSIIGKLVPNRLHPWIVNVTEGRAMEDTFPAYYRANSRGSIKRLCQQSGLLLERLDYLGQYPAAFMFNPALFYVATGYEKLLQKIDLLKVLRGWLLVVVRKPAED